MKLSDLSKTLSKDFPPGKYELLYIETVPYKCKNLILSQRRSSGSQQNSKTIKVKHFISISDAEGIIIMGIEIYTYLIISADKIDYHLFVSKVDTTGLSSKKFKIGRAVELILNYFLDMNVKRYCTKIKILKNDALNGKSNDSNTSSLKKVREMFQKYGSSYYKSIAYYNLNPVPLNSSNYFSIDPPSHVSGSLSFFTRAAEQYLFPNSSKNPHKHMVDGNTLLNWWIKVTDRVIGARNERWVCKLSVPGSDKISTKKRLPDSDRWSLGNIFSENLQDLAIYAIPLFPDDPKGRFIEHLVVENRYQSTSVEQFWEELGYRQEFRLGNVVGIIGCKEIAPQKSEQNSEYCGTVLSLNLYKKIMKAIKNVDFLRKDEVKNLSKVKIPQIVNKLGHESVYIPFCGTEKIPQQLNSVPQKNKLDVSSGIKRPVETNNINNLIRKKRKA